VDFTPIPTVDQRPPAVAGLHFFGVVQYIGNDRAEDWTEFYQELFGFTDAASTTSASASCPRAASCAARAPVRTFYLQLIEPEPACWTWRTMNACSASAWAPGCAGHRG
jgi:4-hydroxyphenylpyruvate dioxygenase